MCRKAKVELGAKRPDYAFFENEVTLNEVFEKKGIDDLYLKALALGDAKSWKTSLDKKAKEAKGSFEFQNPSFQIDYIISLKPILSEYTYMVFLFSLLCCSGLLQG